MLRQLHLACVAVLLTLSSAQAQVAPLAPATKVRRQAIARLTPSAVIPLGKTADWVEVTQDTVWVGSTGPNAVHRIDPATNRVVAAFDLPGEPCAGLAAGFGSIWVPLCGKPNRMAKIDAASKTVTVFDIGPLAEEGGVTTSADSVWLVSARQGELHRIDPVSGATTQIVKVPEGSYNPRYYAGQIWLTRADGAEVTVVDAASGKITTRLRTGPGPRFLTAGAGSVWILNQGDGTLTHIDAVSHAVLGATSLNTPGHGGDISLGGGMVWTTMAKVPLSMIDAASGKLRCQWTGPGGDSLGVGHDAIWLTDYHRGTVSRYGLRQVIASCK